MSRQTDGASDQSEIALTIRRAKEEGIDRDELKIHLKSFNVPHLKAFLKSQGAAASGLKPYLIDRIIACFFDFDEDGPPLSAMEFVRTEHALAERALAEPTRSSRTHRVGQRLEGTISCLEGTWGWISCPAISFDIFAHLGWLCAPLGAKVSFVLGYDHQSGKHSAEHIKLLGDMPSSSRRLEGTMGRFVGTWGWISCLAISGDIFAHKDLVAAGHVLLSGAKVSFVLGYEPQRGKPRAEDIWVLGDMPSSSGSRPLAHRLRALKVAALGRREDGRRAGAHLFRGAVEARARAASLRKRPLQDEDPSGGGSSTAARGARRKAPRCDA